MPAITKADLLAAQRDGQSQAETARRFGVSHTTVLRAEARHGIHLDRNRERRPWSTHRDVVAEMRPAEAVEYLLEVIAALQTPIKPGWAWCDIHMSPKQKLILRCLAEAKGAVVPREAIMRAYMADSADGIWPDTKMLSVQIYRMRSVIAPHGIEILTAHSEGYALYAPPGFVWPWEE